MIRRSVKKLFKRALRHPRLKPFFSDMQTIWREARAEQAQSLTEVLAMADVPEITPIALRTSTVDAAARLNLLVPALSDQHVFGGIATALRCLDALRAHFTSVRILVTDEGAITPGKQSFYGDWPLHTLAQDDCAGSHIVSCGMRQGLALPVHDQDVFMATAWWTAHIAFPVLEWQDARFGVDPRRRLLYLIQDFEPGFYPWSDRYALADASYRHPERTNALFNTGILAGFFEREGYRFASRHELEPRLNPTLAAARSRIEAFSKERVILVYGRPSVARNAFGLILAALKLWAREYPGAAQWQVVSAGEAFAPVELGPGSTLQSLGKLSLEEYAQWLARSAVGVSLMISPHPSYPPLEMAAFGIQVLSNRYANKDLSEISPCLHSLDRIDPWSLAQAIIERCAAFDAAGAASHAIPLQAIEWHGPFLDPGSELTDLSSLLAQIHPK